MDQENTRGIQPLLVSIKDAATMLDLSKAKVYELITQGHIKPVSIGMSRKIKMADLLHIIDNGLAPITSHLAKQDQPETAAA